MAYITDSQGSPIGGERWRIPAGTPIHYEVLPATARRPRQQIGGLTHTTLTSGRVNLARVAAPTSRKRQRSATGAEMAAHAKAALDKLLGR
jgi:hypothetical protein